MTREIKIKFGENNIKTFKEVFSANRKYPYNTERPSPKGDDPDNSVYSWIVYRSDEGTILMISVDIFGEQYEGQSFDAACSCLNDFEDYSYMGVSNDRTFIHLPVNLKGEIDGSPIIDDGDLYRLLESMSEENYMREIIRVWIKTMRERMLLSRIRRNIKPENYDEDKALALLRKNKVVELGEDKDSVMLWFLREKRKIKELIEDIEERMGACLCAGETNYTEDMS